MKPRSASTTAAVALLFAYLPPSNSSYLYPTPAKYHYSTVQQVKDTRHRRQSPQLHTSSANNAEDTTEDPDLFDYFDPLLSPHAYPKGIAPSSRVGDTAAATPPPPPLQRVDNNEVRADDNQEQEEELYDALGWSSVARPMKTSTKRNTFKVFGIALPSDDDAVSTTTSNIIASSSSSSSTKTTTTFPAAAIAATDLRPLVDPSTTFDPTLSPHVYAKGVPDVIVGDAGTAYIYDMDSNNEKKEKILGILLMDHGSRNEASNQRLHELARLYEKSVVPATATHPGTTRIVVKAAHMEIATPSVQDGIQALLLEGVDEIVCHPYFLSPGRHVVEDIPRIVAAAIETLSVEIPVRTTDPVGSVTDIMIGAIHSLVEETSELFKATKK